MAVCEDGLGEHGKRAQVTRLLVVRHAQSVWNAAGRWQGWSDAPLSPLGVDQAQRAGRALAAAGVTPAVVACSDLQRARRTAELIADEVGYDRPLAVDRRLREQDLGEWNGLTSAEIEARWPGEVLERRAGRLDQVPGGEPGDHFFERCLGAVYAVATAAATAAATVAGTDGAATTAAISAPADRARNGAQAIVVAHGGVLMALERVLGTWRPGQSQSNLTGWWVESRGVPPDLELLPLHRADLLALGPRAVTGRA